MSSGGGDKVIGGKDPRGQALGRIYYVSGEITKNWNRRSTERGSVSRS